MPADGDGGSSWVRLRDRLLSFGKHPFGFEAKLDHVAKAQAEQERVVDDLRRRLERIEAQHEIILRLLEPRR